MRAQESAILGAGQSDVLYESRLQSAFLEILAGTNESERQETGSILVQFGYDPNYAPYEPGGNECSLTGIEINSCPCGRHE